MSRYINHITLNTGHMRRQPRSEIGNDAIAALAGALDGILRGAAVPVPDIPGYTISGANSGHDLIATVWCGAPAQRVPIITSGVALRSRSAPALWRLLHTDATLALATTEADRPSAPWVADRIEPGALSHQDAMQWTGDLSRCLAWAWLEYREDLT